MSNANRERAQSLTAVSVPRAVGAFLLAGLLVVVTVGALLAWAQHRTATAEAIRDARTLTNLEAGDVIGPVLTDAALRPRTGPGRPGRRRARAGARQPSSASRSGTTPAASSTATTAP